MRKLNKWYIYSINVKGFICMLIFWGTKFIMNFNSAFSMIKNVSVYKKGNKVMIIFSAILETW